MPCGWWPLLAAIFSFSSTASSTKCSARGGPPLPRTCGASRRPPACDGFYGSAAPLIRARAAEVLACVFGAGSAYFKAYMYLSFYGFKEMPFNVTPDPKFLFLSPNHQEALQHLKFGVRERKGFIVLIGEVGCGKTTICRRFLNELDPARFDTALILNPRVTETQMLKAILRELGETKLARSHVDLVSQMNRVLLERIARGRDIVLIIDEAQNLSTEVLEQVRLLSNLETDKQKLLQIVLLGQPELKDILARDELRQLRQRILVHYELHPLSRRDMAPYIQHRCASASWSITNCIRCRAGTWPITSSTGLRSRAAPGGRRSLPGPSGKSTGPAGESRVS